MQRILVVDDDPGLAELLKEYLSSRGLEVETVGCGEDALTRLPSGGLDLVVLDVMLPGADGFEVLGEIRRSMSIPVIMLTARGEDMDRVVGLEMGADDYLSKPFNPRELLARIKAVLRRSAGEPPEEAAPYASGIRVDIGRREVQIDGQLVELTTTEFEILRVLVASAGRVVPRERLMEQARGPEWAAYERSVDVHISHLRKKLGDTSRRPKLIKTIRGVGYLVPV
jgi:DNA-binding response OmpR family regulator